MTERRRQALILVVLVAVFAVVLGRQLLPRMESSDIAASARSFGSGGSGRRAAGASRRIEVVDLRLDDLTRPAAHYSPGRDPFRFAPRQPQSAPPARDIDREEQLRRAREAALEARRTTSATPVSARAQPPPVDLVFLGSFGPRNRRLAVFSDGNDIYNAFKGDILKDKFIVVEIGYESADLGFVGFPEAPAERLAAGG